MHTTQPALAHSAVFRFYGDLGDFLDRPDSGLERSYRFRGRPAVKDAIEAQGVPHTEIGLILANGEPVGFEFGLSNGDHITVFPEFGNIDIGPLGSLLRAPPERIRFVLDVNLGKLARWLRLLGFDTVYQNDFADAQVAAVADNELRIVLTRDRRLLHQKRIRHGYWVRADDPDRQVVEVLRRLHLADRIRPLARCLDCNGLIESVSKDEVMHRLEPKTKLYYDTFFRCADCGKVYWRGSHYEGIIAKLWRATGAKASAIGFSTADEQDSRG